MPEKQQHLERRVFQLIDDQAAPALVKLNAADSQPLSLGESAAWTGFILSLLHRTPQAIASGRRFADTILTATLEDLRARYDELKEEGDPRTFEEWKASLTADDNTRSFMRILPGVMLNPKIGIFLAGLTWRTFDLTDGCPDLLLSDEPIARTNGLANPLGHLAMALSPRRLLVGAYKAELLDHFHGQRLKSTAALMNACCVSGARHFVAARDLTQDRFIRNRFGSDAKPTLADLVPRNFRV